MKILKVIIPIVLILLPAVLHGEMAAVLQEPGKVSSIAVDDQQLYVIEQTTVHIYKLEDYSYVKKFGKGGEGPQEFLNVAIVTPLEDRLLIFSFGKISYYSKDGVFQNEQKVQGGMIAGFAFKPVGDNYVGASRAQGDDGIYSTVNIYDNLLNKKKELIRIKFGEKGQYKMNLFNMNTPYEAYGDKAYIDTKDGFSIQITDLEGNKISKIEQKDYKQRKFTDDDLKRITDILKKQIGEAQYEAAKNRFEWPDYYPTFFLFNIDRSSKKLIVLTWKMENGKYECFVYALDGKREKRLILPIILMDGTQPYPYFFNAGKLYQVIDNDEEEQWELHVHKLY